MPETALLEIGVEDLPPSFVQEALIQLKEKGKELFASSRLEFKEIFTLGSSRRLVFWAKGVSCRQKEKIEKEMGPPREVVFDEKGGLTSGGRKYLQAKGARKEDLGVEKLKKGEYVYIKRKRAGERTRDLLPSLFPQLIQSLPFSRSMRWGKGNFYFGRPIRSLLALFGDEVIEFEVAGVTSDRKTRGHHYLSPSAFSVRNPQDYLSLLRKKGVILDPEERRKLILEQAKKITLSLKEKGQVVRVLEDEELLREIVYLVEHPTLFLGEFDPAFLSLPPPILRACLRDYQKHFSVVDEDKPLAYFVGVREGDKKFLEEVVEGNRRVLNARLNDARFFLEEDKKVPLEKRVKSLQGIIVQKKLGSYYDKTRRLIKLAEGIASYLGEAEEVKERVKRGAYLCKADLVTQVVREFPTLEGVMGKEYALHSGEHPRVAQVILEHRLPRFSGDELPQTREGTILALADKMDTLVGFFWAGLIPSGSQDPWGLRREGQAVVEILLKKKWKVSLDYLIKESLKLYGDEGGKTDPKVKEFFRARLVNVLKDRDVRADQIKATLRVGFDDMGETIKRGKALHQASFREGFREEVIAIIRLVNILKQAQDWGIKIPEKAKEDLLIKREEKDLYGIWKEIKEEAKYLLNNGRYLEAYQRLSTLKDPIHNFFEGVLVMSEDENLRVNRLSLLREIGDLFKSIADFTHLQVK